ncbi:glycosyltransferase family 1 protein [Olivibacter ginsenosidimutans]|uniref:Glycosyltransferase family 1 protein n=1 Tax=Olivibacter ginsenosidimutans TaxID=1176537 RepID=A0ABP9BAN7_9SPHI
MMKKKIAFISEHASPLAILGGIDSGGQNVYVAELAKQLAKRGYEIDIFTRKDHKRLPKMVQLFPGVRVIHVKAGPPIPMPKEKLLDYMDEFRQDMINFMDQQQLVYQLVHANFWMSAMVGLAIKMDYGIPLVVTFHALGKVRRHYLKQQDNFPDERLMIEENIARHADCIIAECPQDKHDLMTLYGADTKRIVIVPCGFNPKEFYPIAQQQARKRLKLKDDEKIILQLGRMVPRKGIDNVIRALKYIKNDFKVRLVVVGGDGDEAHFLASPELQRLKKIAQALGKDAHVDFVGPKKRKELKYYYNAADVFVSTPWYEPFGITPLEAMACGTPVIGSNVGGIKYSVCDGVTGYLVEPKKPKALAQKLHQLFSTNDQKMGVHAVERVNTLFTWEKISYSIEQVYERYIQANRLLDDVQLKQLLPEAQHQLKYNRLTIHQLREQHHAS